MTMLAQMTARERRTRWWCIGALFVALPAAVLVRSYSDALEWRKTLELDPVVAPSGGTASYAGAEWRLSGLYKLAEPGKPAATVLAEIEAIVADPAVFAAGGPCQVALTDSEGRRWEPLFLAPRAIRKARPEVSDMPTCNVALSKAPKAGDRIMIAEAFTIPSELKTLDVVISVAGQRPAYLRLE